MTEPVGRVSRCATFFSFQNLKNIASCTLSRITISGLAEMIFGSYGKSYSRNVADSLVPRLGQRLIMPFTRAGCLLALPIAFVLTAGKTAKARLLILGATAAGAAIVWSAFSLDLTRDTANETLSTAIAMVGENICGFIGLDLAGRLFKRRDIVYLGEDPSAGYGIGMARYQFASLFYNAVVNPTIAILNIPCALVGMVVKTAAFNWNILFPYVEKVLACFKKNQLSGTVIQPLLSQLLARRFLDSKAAPVHQSKIYSIFLEVWKSSLKAALAATPFSQWNELEYEDLIVRLAGHTLKAYGSILKHTPEIQNAQTEFQKEPGNKLKAARLDEEIRKEIQKDQTISQSIRSFLYNRVDLWTKPGSAIVDAIIEMEIGFFGGRLLNEDDELFLRTIIPIHLKHFVHCGLLHLQKFTKEELDPCEEIGVVWDLNHAILSSYLDHVLPSWASRWIRKGVHKLEGATFTMQKKLAVFSHKSEQRATLTAPIALAESHVVKPPKHTPDDIEAFDTNQDMQPLEQVATLQVQPNLSDHFQKPTKHTADDVEAFDDDHEMEQSAQASSMQTPFAVVEDYDPTKVPSTQQEG
ncbi:MAG: hypothetical protein JSS32_07665 [Verrucomicrobia bacterium]|nr:hypothetical protein [Verrucomicrobiota bacterium]